MGERPKKDDLERIRDAVDKKIEARKERARAAARQRGPRGPDDEWAKRRGDATRASVLGRWAFFAARFGRAAECWRAAWELELLLARTSAAEKAAKKAGWLSRLLRRSSPEAAPPGDSADFGDPSSTQSRHRFAWQVGRLDLLAAAVEREASGERWWSVGAREWRLANIAAPLEWRKRQRAHLDAGPREYVRSKHRDPAEWPIAEALDVEARIAFHLFWLGETAEAHDVAERALADADDWLEARVQIWTDETPDLRATYGGELRALQALTRPDGPRPAEAVAHARAALLGCLRGGSDGESRHEDLPWIHLVALARSEPEAAAIADFRTHFPWLTHLLE